MFCIPSLLKSYNSFLLKTGRSLKHNNFPLQYANNMRTAMNG